VKTLAKPAGGQRGIECPTSEAYPQTDEDLVLFAPDVAMSPKARPSRPDVARPLLHYQPAARRHAMVFWYRMWGVPGAIIATPMPAVAKIICDRIDALKPFGHFIEG
jgi:hypothetical protein